MGRFIGIHQASGEWSCSISSQELRVILRANRVDMEQPAAGRCKALKAIQLPVEEQYNIRRRAAGDVFRFHPKRHQSQELLPHRAEDAPQLDEKKSREAVEPVASCRHHTGLREIEHTT
jgi:hypothetical protein